LRLVGEVADGWVPSMGRAPLDELRRAAAMIEETAVRTGRDPAAIRRIYNISGSISETAGEGGGLQGPPDTWVETLAAWRDDPGVDGFIFWPPDFATDQVERFATEVVPGLRTAIGAGA
jgi:alkanesulfonate monooxygenase SsuD/methylene tetrahydromethanopterin reductase-like flavin-dependent oxidoreductase (luciferase family)